MMVDLRSDELEQQEVAVVLPEMVQRMTAGVDVRASIEVIGPPRPVSPVVQKNLLRLFQEAMTNALKHGRARNIHVELKYNTAGLMLQVHDDGCGFDIEKTMPLGTGHFGLIGMRERAERIGGVFTLRSSPGQGTEIRVEVPSAELGDRR